MYNNQKKKLNLSFEKVFSDLRDTDYESFKDHDDCVGLEYDGT